MSKVSFFRKTDLRSGQFFPEETDLRSGKVSPRSGKVSFLPRSVFEGHFTDLGQVTFRQGQFAQGDFGARSGHFETMSVSARSLWDLGQVRSGWVSLRLPIHANYFVWGYVAPSLFFDALRRERVCAPAGGAVRHALRNQEREFRPLRHAGHRIRG